MLSSSSTGEGALYQSYFYPTQFEAEREIKYAGFVQSLFVDTYGNFREDTVKDNRLVLNEDRIVISRYDPVKDQLVMDVYIDATEMGKPTRIKTLQFLLMAFPMWPFVAIPPINATLPWPISPRSGKGDGISR